MSRKGPKMEWQIVEIAGVKGLRLTTANRVNLTQLDNDPRVLYFGVRDDYGSRAGAFKYSLMFAQGWCILDYGAFEHSVPCDTLKEANHDVQRAFLSRWKFRGTDAEFLRYLVALGVPTPLIQQLI